MVGRILSIFEKRVDTMREEIKAKFFNSFVFMLMGIMMGAILLTIVGLIYSPDNALLTNITIVAYLSLAIISLPLAAIQYIRSTDRVLSVLFRNITLTIVAYSISGVLWLIWTYMQDALWLYALSDLAIVAGFLPLLSMFFTLLRSEERRGNDQGFSLFIILINVVAVTLVLVFSALSSRAGGMSMHDMVFRTIYTSMDIIIMTLSCLLTLRYMPTKYRYYFAVLFGGSLLSFAGDSLSLLSSLGLYDDGPYAQLFFDAVLLMCTAAFVLITVANVKVVTVEEVDKKLSDLRLQMGDLVTQSPDAMGIFEVGGGLVLANDAFFGVFGGSRSDSPAFNLFKDMQQLSPGIGDQLVLVRAGKAVSIEELEVPSREPARSSPRFVSLRIFPTFSSEGSVTSYISIASDVTVRKRAEDALKRAYQDMESCVRDRTAELEVANRSLQQEIEAHKADEAHIRESLKEKEILLKEIHHRVKNNLQVVSSMLSLQSSGQRDPAVLSLNRESQNRIRSMALIHEKLYQSGTLSRISFGEYVRDLADFILRSYGQGKHVQVDVDFADIWLDINAAVPCGLILNELLTNCMKYAFEGRDGGRVVVSMAHEPGKYVLVVKDDGVGIKGSVNLARADTLGLSLVHALAGQLDGEVEANVDNGTTFRITFAG
jgi:two-component sensor histidine kinase/PAS domain-containing protein